MQFHPDPDIPQFFSPDVARAAAIEMSTLKNWIARKPSPILMSDEDRAAFGIPGESGERMAPASGGRHLFTYRRVLQIAITAELVKLGLPPRSAGIAAAGFTDMSDDSAGWAGAPRSKSRDPGQFFAGADSLLIVGNEGLPGDVLRADEVARDLQKIVRHGAIAILNVSIVDRGVRDRLGLEWDWCREKLTFHGDEDR